MVGFDKCFGRGEIFPFFGLVLVSVFDVPWFESVGSFGEEFAVLGNAAADAGRESEINRLAGFATGASGFV